MEKRLSSPLKWNVRLRLSWYSLSPRSVARFSIFCASSQEISHSGLASPGGATALSVNTRKLRCAVGKRKSVFS